ncbi:unnamed protein product, partial [marine sediment metagenome]
MDEEEKKALLDEFMKKSQAASALEAKADIEKINKLISDERKAHEDLLKGKLTEADFKAYQEKSLEEEKKWKDRVDLIETKMKRLPLEDPEHKAPTPGAAEYKSAFYKFLGGGAFELGTEGQAYFDERKALVSDATGQILIPEELETEIYRVLAQINVMRGLATVRPIKGDRIRRLSLTEVEVGWGKLELGAEAVETDVVPSEAWQYVEDLEGLAKVGKDELADSPVAIEPHIGDSFARAHDDIEEAAWMNGTGHAFEQPEGLLMTGVVTRVEGGQIDAIKTDDVLDLIYALPAQYRVRGTLLFPSTTILAIRKLKDAVNGQYMWQPSMQAGQPATFAGYPVIAQEGIPAIKSALGCDIGVFGDFKAGYRILDRAGMTTQRLIEMYATAGLIGILVSKGRIQA